jgi:hypothetical protein
MRWWLVLAALLCALLPARALAGGGLIVGVDDDTLKWSSTPGDVVTAHRALGLTAVRVTLAWKPGLTKLDDDSVTYVARAQAAARLGERVVLAVYGPAATPPTTPDGRADFCSFVVAALGAARNVYDVVIWNEADSAFFWRPQQGAAAQYEALLETCYDAVHKARKNVNVISSLAPHESPARFVHDLGAAYRAGGRTAPIFDTFGYDAYPEASNESPFVQHPGSASMDEGDYVALMQALTDAFGGTGQPVPGSGGTTPGSVPPGGVPAAALTPAPSSRRNPAPAVVVPDGAVTIWYLEDGFETVVPRARRAAYTGHETNTLLVPALIYRAVAGGPVRDQSSQIRDAIELAYCQPAVGAFFNFQFLDERDLSGWQSGLLWADGTKKPSYPIVQQAIAAVAGGSVECSQLPKAATGLP